MFKKKSVIGDNPYFFKLDQIEGFDIDTLFDFEFAEYSHKKLF
jgi:CMP-N-acetylneuraminic acid synthetase